MKNRNGRWIASLLVAALSQAISAEDVEAAKKQIAQSHAEKQDKGLSDLRGSEASYLVIPNPFVNYHSSFYYPSNISFSYFSPSSQDFPRQPSFTFSFDRGLGTSDQGTSDRGTSSQGTANRGTSDDDVLQQIKCGDTFPRACRYSRYRSYDGSCNNLQNPTWGMANTRYGRLVRARYSDGVRAPTRSVTGASLPLSRTVSYTMFPSLNIDDRLWSLVAMQYGQIMAHDMGLIAGTTQSKSHTTRCCTTDGQLIMDAASIPTCYPILITADDPFYSRFSVQCLNFVRSMTDRDRGCASPYKPAEQLNTVSQYLDLSLVYGSNDRVAASLRAGFGGRLNVEMKNNREFPPSAPNKTAVCDTVSESEPCYATGDLRANQNPQLTILQVAFLREHNRVADRLAQLNPHWADETTFQETRRIVIAEHQYITYYEWLPIFLGFKQVYASEIAYDTRGYVNDYDGTLNGNVLNEHSNSASRFFHTLIAGNLDLVSEHRDYLPSQSLRLSDYFNRPGIIERDDNFDDLTRGFTSQPQRFSDIYFDKEITQYLFRRGRPFGSDLRATDIQRDRDHGLASYNDYREYCGLPRAKGFADFVDHIPPSAVQKLSTLYASPDDVELTVGGSLERLVTGALVGPTFQCIMLRQFQLTRFGDRYWFETGDPSIAFTLEQLNAIRNSSISRLLCDNADHIKYMQRLGFMEISDINPLVSCEQLPQVDLSLWKDYNGGDYDHTKLPLYEKK